MRFLLALVLVGLAAWSALAENVGGRLELAGAGVPGPNLVENGGFEAKGDERTPARWSVGTPDVLTLDTTARSGQAALRLSGADQQAKVPMAEQTLTLTQGYYTLEGWVKTEGLGATRDRTSVRLCLDGRPQVNWWQCTESVRGTRDWKVLRRPMIALPNSGAFRVTVGAYGVPDGSAWFDDVSLVEMRRPLLDVFLLFPNFRGLLFDDGPQAVRLAVAVADAPETRNAKARVRVSLLDEAAGQARASREYPVRPGRLVAEVDAGTLADTAYLARVELVSESGETLHRAADHRIVKVPARTRRRFNAWYDARNVTYLDGRPTFVLGLYNTTGFSTARETYARGRDGWGNARIAEAPFNMMINYWLGAAPVEALNAYMDDLRARGIYYLHTVNFYHADDRQYATIPYPVARQGDDALNRWVAKTLSGHRGLAGFYTADERPAELVPKAFRQRQALAAGAPGTVAYAVVGDGWERQAPLWRDAVDVLGLDPYPIIKPHGQNHLAMVGEWTRLGRDAVQGARPVWMVIQYFPLTGAGGWPSGDELRAMSWMAIVEGAQGLFYWSYGNKGLAWVKDPAERERRWQDLVRVTKEIKALEPALLAPDVAVVAPDASAGPVHVLGKRTADGTRYLFAYNTKPAAARVTWTLADPAREVVELGPPTAPVSLQGNELTAEFAPYEVRRYRMR
ncbi:MAG TPA: hypothetical protein VID04_15130 [Methylomirabilota bacterium]|jgi:hypothetical protein